MTARKIDIDPDLWAKIRIRAFNEQTTATALVHEALTELLARREAGADVIAGAKRRFPKPETTKDVGAADAAPEEAPPVPAAPPAQEDPWSDLTSQPPSSIGKTISGVEDAKRAVAALPAIRPVPKPTSSKTRSKRSSRSATSGTEA